MSVWEQRTSQLRRHMQMSSQEAINKEEPALINPHASIFRRKKQGDGVALEKCTEEQGGKGERPPAEGPEQPAPGANPGGGEDRRTPSPRAKRDKESWHQKSCHGNCEPGEQDGAGGSIEDRARMRQSQRRSRHRRARMEGKEPAGALGSRSASQEMGLEEASPTEGVQDGDRCGDAAAAEALIQGEPEASGEPVRLVPGEGILQFSQLLVLSPYRLTPLFLPHPSCRTNGVPAGDAELVGTAEEGSPPQAVPEAPRGKTGSLTEQDCSSLDTSEQALLEASRTVSRSEPDLSSITPNTEKATESTTIMIDVHDSAVVQSEDLSLFPEPLSWPSGTLWGWKAACTAFPIHIHQLGRLSLLLLVAPPSSIPVLQGNLNAMLMCHHPLGSFSLSHLLPTRPFA